jgi:hypothetical protein
MAFNGAYIRKWDNRCESLVDPSRYSFQGSISFGHDHSHSPSATHGLSRYSCNGLPIWKSLPVKTEAEVSKDVLFSPLYFSNFVSGTVLKGCVNTPDAFCGSTGLDLCPNTH